MLVSLLVFFSEKFEPMSSDVSLNSFTLYYQTNIISLTRCPMKLMNYFRTNSWDTGQFDHTLVVADDKSSMEYYESCTTTSHNVNPLHTAMVEMYYCEEGAEIKYSTMQNCYPWDGSGKGKCTTL